MAKEETFVLTSRLQRLLARLTTAMRKSPRVVLWVDCLSTEAEISYRCVFHVILEPTLRAGPELILVRKQLIGEEVRASYHTIFRPFLRAGKVQRDATVCAVPHCVRASNGPDANETGS